MTSIKDLARHLDISIGTVSRALNNKTDVSQETKSKVLKAAAELGYVPNQAGRSLSKGKTNVIGFVLETDSEGMMQGDLFFIRVFDGMQSVLTKRGLNLVALLSPSNVEPEAYLQQIVARRFTDALVLSSIHRNDARINFLNQQGMPFATLGRSLVDGGQPWLDLDFDGVVEDAIARLTQKGHRTIALALPRNDLNLRHIMIESYRKNIAKAGLQLDEDLMIRISPGDRAGVTLVHQLINMPQKPTAVIYSDHILPFGIYRGLADLGLTPGVDLSLIGVGTRLAAFLTPDLTYYRFNLFDLGVRIAEALLTIMDDPTAAEGRPVVRESVPFTFIEGQSIADLT
ncbi:LacI family DNA-binding transcriptional regulator [Tritonibacter horizontis]|uniref:Catabolite control protein A n=1 Tax=Tritonibacter horizontis TaxID=1768241 RepID=A0A132BQU8_9RHOB|nr:LacI family DNA-binding transcriptional regulator [Tritonibacter horizontis]KUP90779.1 catabolite control protein A [Tritonibacter horizontis]